MSTKKGFYKGTKRGPFDTNRGFTLIELMIVVVIVAIGVSLAVPSYSNTMQRRETTAQALGLASFVSYAQSEAIKSNEMISVHLAYTDKNNWCIGANEGSAPCDCKETVTTEADFCSLNGVANIIESSEQTKSSMTAASTDKTLVFDPLRGTMAITDLGTDHGVTLESDNGNWALQVDIGVTGTVRICNPISSKAVPGYKSCPALSITPILPPPVLPPPLLPPPS